MFNSINKDLNKQEVFAQIKTQMESLGFTVIAHDIERPWGAFLVIEPSQIKAFQKKFFEEVTLSFDDKLSYSPKILLVAPEQKLSWQYHHRRAEIWKVIGGEAGVVISDTDEETSVTPLSVGTVIHLNQGERHRLVGLSTYGVVAEIWKHTDKENPSDEEDIVRVQDDFCR